MPKKKKRVKSSKTKKESKNRFTAGKILLLIVTIIFTFFVIMGAFAALFADGGTILERIFLLILNPLGTIAVYYGLLAKLSKQQKTLILTIITINLVYMLYIALTIILGFDKGDWFTPILLVFPQILYFFYSTSNS